MIDLQNHPEGKTFAEVVMLQFHTSPAQTGAVSYCRSPGASVRLRIFVAAHQPGTAASSAPGCPPEAGTQKEQKAAGDAPALAFGKNSL